MPSVLPTKNDLSQEKLASLTATLRNEIGPVSLREDSMLDTIVGDIVFYRDPVDMAHSDLQRVSGIEGRENPSQRLTENTLVRLSSVQGTGFETPLKNLSKVPEYSSHYILLALQSNEAQLLEVSGLEQPVRFIRGGYDHLIYVEIRAFGCDFGLTLPVFKNPLDMKERQPDEGPEDQMFHDRHGPQLKAALLRTLQSEACDAIPKGIR